VKSNQIASVLGFSTWLISSCAFALNFGNTIFALALVFSPCIASFGRKEIGKLGSDNLTFITGIISFALGAGIYYALAPIGGLSYLADVLFKNNLVLLTSNGLFVVYLIRRFDLLTSRHAPVISG